MIVGLQSFYPRRGCTLQDKQDKQDQQDRVAASADLRAKVAQIRAGWASAKLGLLQIESWSSDGVAVVGRALQGPKGIVALGDSWLAGLLPESWVHITGHTGLTGPTGQGGG